MYAHSVGLCGLCVFVVKINHGDTECTEKHGVVMDFLCDPLCPPCLRGKINHGNTDFTKKHRDCAPGQTRQFQFFHQLSNHRKPAAGKGCALPSPPSGDLGGRSNFHNPLVSPAPFLTFNVQTLIESLKKGDL